jgi:hypothetical protein
MARDFASRMNKVGDVLLMNVSKTIREAAMAATREVILRTPVKTGRARINWRLSARSPKTGVKEGPDTPKVDTNRQIASTEALINASNAIKGWKVGGGNIYIANAVSYINDLDKGTGSAQARQGMTMFAIAAAKKILKKGRLLRGS